MTAKLIFEISPAAYEDLPEDIQQKVDEMGERIIPKMITISFRDSETDYTEVDFAQLGPSEWLDAGIGFAIAEALSVGLQSARGTSFAAATEYAEEKHTEAKRVWVLEEVKERLELALATAEGEC